MLEELFDRLRESIGRKLFVRGFLLWILVVGVGLSVTLAGLPIFGFRVWLMWLAITGALTGAAVLFVRHPPELPF